MHCVNRALHSAAMTLSRRRAALLAALFAPLALYACAGSSGTTYETSPTPDAGNGTDSAPPPTADASAPDSNAACPDGATPGTANGLPVCRAASGIPLFTNVFVVLMENTSLSTLSPQMQDGGVAPTLAGYAAKYATGSDYHGVVHPSLPNYVALVSGDPQGIACDCKAIADAGTCGALCNATFNSGNCSCDVSASNIGDQLETAGKTWMAFAEGMGAQTPCNVVDDSSTSYAVRHVPFLYFDDVQTNATRCEQHAVDYSLFDPASPAAFNFIAPNLVDDMHDPFPAGTTNIANGDKWIGPQVDAILASKGYTSGGLLVVVWDEDDLSGAGPLNTDNPVPIFVFSPYAKSGGYVSGVKADHYALLATFEDGLGLPRLGSAAKATPLTDYFPTQ
jgi:hypothetical protein